MAEEAMNFIASKYFQFTEDGEYVPHERDRRPPFLLEDQERLHHHALSWGPVTHFDADVYPEPMDWRVYDNGFYDAVAEPDTEQVRGRERDLASEHDVGPEHDVDPEHVLPPVPTMTRTLPGPTLPGLTLPGLTLPGLTLPGPTLPDPTLPGPTLPGPTLPDPTRPGPTLSGPNPPASAPVSGGGGRPSNSNNVGLSLVRNGKTFPKIEAGRERWYSQRPGQGHRSYSRYSDLVSHDKAKGLTPMPKASRAELQAARRQQTFG
jgi:hypothetical protein